MFFKSFLVQDCYKSGLCDKELYCTLFARLFSEKTQGFAIALASSSVLFKILTFCNISITEDIYLDLGICIHYPKSNPYYQRRQFKMIFFFRIMPLFRLKIFMLYQASHSRALAPACCALVLFSSYRV